MNLNEDKIDDAALAILSLTLHSERRVWKGIDWQISDRLYKKGFIETPVGKAESLVLTDKGIAHARENLVGLFGAQKDGER